MSVIRARMCEPEEAVIGPSEECGAAQSPIDEIMTRRIACRDFCDAPVSRRMIEQILHVARFAPSGANIQPWHVYVLSGAGGANIFRGHTNVQGAARQVRSAASKSEIRPSKYSIIYVMRT